MRKGCTMACNSVSVRGTRVGQVCHHSRVRSVSSCPLSAIVGPFAGPLWPIFDQFRSFSAHFRPIFGPLSAIWAMFCPFTTHFRPVSAAHLCQFSTISDQFGLFSVQLRPKCDQFRPFKAHFRHIFGHFQPISDQFGPFFGTIAVTARPDSGI